MAGLLVGGSRPGASWSGARLCGAGAKFFACTRLPTLLCSGGSFRWRSPVARPSPAVVDKPARLQVSLLGKLDFGFLCSSLETEEATSGSG